jgi:hypothetical protein
MTQPPQPPEEPPGPDAYGQQPAGGGYAFPAGTTPEPPKKRNTGVLVAIIVGAALLLAGGGTGIYFLTKGEDTPSASNNQSPNVPTFGPSSPGPGGSSPSESQPPQSEAERQAPPTTTTTEPAPPPNNPPPPNTPPVGADDAKIVEIARKYADAVSKQDENAAKQVTCAKDAGLLYSSAGKVEVTGNPQKYTEDTASVPVKITIEQADPFEDLPLFMEKKDGGWCVS